MRTFLISLFLALGLPALNGQKALRVYIGGTVSNAKFHLIDNSNGSDTAYLRKNNIILPNIGIDIEVNITNKSSILTGLGIFWIGSKNFNDLPPNGINIDKDLKLGYLRIPVHYKFYLNEDFTTLTGINLNYNFRKNQGFFALTDNGSAESIYSPYHLALNIGIEQRFQNITLHLSYQKGLTKIFDSQHIQTNSRVFLTSSAFIFNLGYIIE